MSEKVLKLKLAAAAVVSLVLLAPGAAGAATITPSTFADEFGSGPNCSLREAVQAANTDVAFGGCGGGSGVDNISLRAGTYLLTIAPAGNPNDNASGDLDIFAGAGTNFAPRGSGRVTIDSRVQDRILDLTADSSSSTIRGVVLTGGESPDSGGALQSRGIVNVLNSAFVGNSANQHGGAVAVRGSGNGPTFVNVTFSGNRAGSDGGSIDVDGAGVQATLIYSTLSANTADANNDGSGTGGGFHMEQGTLLLTSTIVAGNTDRGGQTPDCSGTANSDGFNLIGTTGCTFNSSTADKVNVPPLLGPLADNGGPTPTHALLPASQAVGAGGPAGTGFDQRGAPRDTRPDIGAYERVLCGGVLVNRVGTPGNDTLRGTSGADGILGLGGKDNLVGRGGKDGLCGGGGRDKLKGGGGKDRLLGQGGPDRLTGGKGSDRCKGGAGRDVERSC